MNEATHYDLDAFSKEVSRRSIDLPYKVTSEVDIVEGIVLLRGVREMGLRINGATTGWALRPGALASDHELDRAFRFLDTCLGSEQL